MNAGQVQRFTPESSGGKVKRIVVILLALLAVSAKSAGAAPASSMKVGVVGLVHDHVGAFFKGGALAPARGVLNRADGQLGGIVEPDQKLFDSYAQRYHLSTDLHFRSIQEMVARAHPQAILVFTATNEHRRV